MATGSAPRSVPGIEIDRKQIITSDEAIAPARGAEVDRHHGQRRRRRRVRVDLPPLRQRGHDHRAAAAPGARSKTRRCRPNCRRRSRSAASTCTPARRSPAAKVGADGVDIEMQRRPTAQAEKLHDETTCSWPPAAVRSPRGSAPRRSASSWIAATSCVDDSSARTCRASRPSATSSRWAARHSAARARVVGGRHRCWPSASPASEVQPINYDHVPGCTYCEPGDRQRRPDRGAGEGARLRRARRARSRSACSAARRWRARPTAS